MLLLSYYYSVEKSFPIAHPIIIILPVGNTMLQINTEGIFPTQDPGLIFLENDPPTHIEFRALGVLQISLNENNSIGGITGKPSVQYWYLHFS